MLFNIMKTYTKDLAEAGDWSGVVEALNDSTLGVKNKTLRTTRWLMDEFDAVIDVNTGATEADLILSTLGASSVPRVKAALSSMSSDGIDFSSDQVQGMIDILASAGGWSDDLRDRLKGFGVSSQTLAESSGFPEITTNICEKHWNAGIAVENEIAIYSDKRVLFSFNAGPKSTSYNIRQIPIGTLDGVDIKGKPIVSGGLVSEATGKELQLVNAIQSAIDAYVGE